MLAQEMIYALVSKGDQTILSSYSVCDGNFQAVALQIINQLDKTKTFCQFATNSYKFYTYTKEGFIFLSMVESDYETRIAFAYLKKIQEHFFGMFNAQTRNSASAPLKQFDEVLRKEIQNFSDKTKVDKLSQLKKELADLQQNLHKKINQKNNGHII